MAGYRLSFLDEFGQSIEARELTCASDLNALCTALQMQDDRAVEVWQDQRLLAKFERPEVIPAF